MNYEIINKGISHNKVLYADTDQMGVVYHSNYFRWFEQGRTELLKKWGVTYKDYEKAGFQLPVVEADIRYRQAALYDDELRIESRVVKAKRASILFSYEIYQSNGDESRKDKLLVTGHTKHANLSLEGKVKPWPSFMQNILDQIKGE